jgi:hypothetical protein
VKQALQESLQKQLNTDNNYHKPDIKNRAISHVVVLVSEFLNGENY